MGWGLHGRGEHLTTKSRFGNGTSKREIFYGPKQVLTDLGVAPRIDIENHSLVLVCHYAVLEIERGDGAITQDTQ